MCWSLRVYGTVLHNLLLRCFTTLVNVFYDCYSCCCCCCCCCECDDNAGGGDGKCFGCNCCDCDVSELRPYETKEYNAEILRELNAAECGEVIIGGGGGGGTRGRLALSGQHDYVIVDELDANYLEISQRKVETEAYYLIVDRAQAENTLSVDYGDGACLVRPYKEADIEIKYIVSVYAQQQFFHLFIRKMVGQEWYGIGQTKRNERLFHSPCDIIDFYTNHPLQCSNKQITLSLRLKPIAI